MNKFKVVKWCTDARRVTIWGLPSKNFFFENIHSQYMFDSYCPQDYKEKSVFYIDHRPSIKERAWFMSYLKSGAFLIDGGHTHFDWIPKGTDRGIFMDYNPSYTNFFRRNSTIVTLKTYRDYQEKGSGFGGDFTLAIFKI